MSAVGFEGSGDAQESASILLLRVASRLLGEARRRGDFGTGAALSERAVELAAELTGGAPSPDPRRAPVEVELVRPDRISLLAPFEEGSATTWSLMLDGTLYGGATMASYAGIKVDGGELSEEEQAELERRQTERRVEAERRRQFTATRFTRALAAPPQSGATVSILAILLYDDGFYVEATYDKEAPPVFDPDMDAEAFFASMREEKPAITVEDDLGTEYFESGGGGWGGGIRVSHSSFGFAPAPPPAARALRITAAGDAVVELDLSPDGR